MACNSCEARRRALFGDEKVNGIFQDFRDWLARPYGPDMTVMDWFLFIGLVLVAILAWSTIVNKVID